MRTVRSGGQVLRNIIEIRQLSRFTTATICYNRVLDHLPLPLV